MDKINPSPATTKKNSVLKNGHDIHAKVPRQGNANSRANKKKLNENAAKDQSPVVSLPSAVAAVEARDWSKTLFLPQTNFGMKAGLPQLEPKLLERWQKLGLYKLLRKAAKGREKFVLHDGPPYANAHIHLGTAVNKVLKDVVTRSHQMMGFDANYVPGFDCHGLPIEWKVEEAYRAKQKNKDDIPIPAFRKECREYAQHWIGIQTEEFKRLGVEGDWKNYYATMTYEAEAAIAGELLKFAMNGSLYRGSKPVMWSVVEGTALAEAEIEYHEHTSPAVWVKFPVEHSAQAIWTSTNPTIARKKALTVGQVDAAMVGGGASILIWTTTPWTLPANRAISFSSKINYGLYEVTEAPADNWVKTGEKLIMADSLAEAVLKQARIEKWHRIDDVNPSGLVCKHPLRQHGFNFHVPLLDGDHVTETAGTGFVHTAPGHGSDDYDIWMANKRKLTELGIDDTVPDTVGPDGYYRRHVPVFGGDQSKRVIDDKGSFGKLDTMAYANAAVIEALKQAGALAALNPRYKHDYPHSWRSKAPVIFRNTPQWFIAIDKAIKVKGVKGKATIRDLAMKALSETRFVPPQGRNRIGSMIEARPDYVISRQRVWGVPIAIFVHKETGEILPNAKWKGARDYTKRLTTIFAAEGVDPWFEADAKTRFLQGLVDNPEDWDQVRDILDVWFDSASTHVFVLKKRRDLKWPADVYLEGSDQHRGWFHSTLLESCGTVGRAPYNALVTHGFVLDENGRKMSKSLGNTIAPQDIIKQNGADILRLWALSSDYTEDMRIGKQILQSTIDGYRKLRNTLRYLLGNLAHYNAGQAVDYAEMPELERWVLHRVTQLDESVRKAYADFDFKRVCRLVGEFCSNDLSAVYFDIRKDTLYCEAPSSLKRLACLTVLDILFECLTRWLAPILCFTAEEAWLERSGDPKKGSVHLQTFFHVPPQWRDENLAARWDRIWSIRRVITGALEGERREKRIGSSLEAAPEIIIADKALLALAKQVDWAEIAITSGATLKSVGRKSPEGFALSDVPGVTVLPHKAEGKKCARSWRITRDVGLDPDYPELSARDAAAMRERDHSPAAA